MWLFIFASLLFGFECATVDKAAPNADNTVMSTVVEKPDIQALSRLFSSLPKVVEFDAVGDVPPEVLEIFDRNELWQKHIEQNREHAAFFTQMLSSRHIQIVPERAYRLFDLNPNCFLLLAFNSAWAEQWTEVTLLTDILGNYFKDRCSLAVVDLSYPSNFDTFAFNSAKTPFLIVKNPNTIANVFEQKDWMHSQDYNLTLMETSLWGEMIPNTEIRSDLETVLGHIDFVYQKSSPLAKDFSIFKPWDAPRPWEGFDKSPRKLEYKLQFQELLKLITNYAQKTAEAEGNEDDLAILQSYYDTELADGLQSAIASMLISSGVAKEGEDLTPFTVDASMESDIPELHQDQVTQWNELFQNKPDTPL